MITLQQAIQKKYPKYADKMAYYVHQATDCELTWENMTKPNLSDISLSQALFFRFSLKFSTKIHFVY